MKKVGLGTIILITSSTYASGSFERIGINGWRAKALILERRDYLYTRCNDERIKINAEIKRLSDLPGSQDALDNMTRSLVNLRAQAWTLMCEIMDKCPVLPDGGIHENFDEWVEKINQYDEEMSARVKLVTGHPLSHHIQTPQISK